MNKFFGGRGKNRPACYEKHDYYRKNIQWVHLMWPGSYVVDHCHLRFNAMQLRTVGLKSVYSWMSSQIWSFNLFSVKILSFQQKKSSREEVGEIIHEIDEQSNAREKSFIFFLSFQLLKWNSEYIRYLMWPISRGKISSNTIWHTANKQTNNKRKRKRISRNKKTECIHIHFFLSEAHHH